MSVYFDVGAQQRRDFSLEEVLLRIMDSFIVQKGWFKVKTP